MIDFSNAPFKARFVNNATAEKITDEKEKIISKGKKTFRMKLLPDSDKYAIAITSTFNEKPALGFFERLFGNIVIVKVKDEAGTIKYVKANAESLRKRLGLSKEEFKKIKESEKTHPILDKKIKEICIPKLMNGSLEGKGIMVDDKGIKYEGIFKNGVFIKGTVTYPNGEKFLQLPDGTQYKGQFENEMFEGEGTLLYPNGNSFHGIFNEGKLIDGTFSFFNGAKYIGKFKDGKFEGEGSLIDFDGIEYRGIFKDGIFIEGIVKPRDETLMYYQLSDGTKYRGNFNEDGNFDGEGSLIAFDGIEYSGTFKDGIFIQGFVKPRDETMYFQFSDGTKYRGNFNKDGKFDGEGMVVYPDKTELQGTFKEGTLIKGIIKDSNGQITEVNTQS